MEVITLLAKKSRVPAVPKLETVEEFLARSVGDIKPVLGSSPMDRLEELPPAGGVQAPSPGVQAGERLRPRGR
jgi:hypothetical protein